VRNSDRREGFATREIGEPLRLQLAICGCDEPGTGGLKLAEDECRHQIGARQFDAAMQDIVNRATRATELTRNRPGQDAGLVKQSPMIDGPRAVRRGGQ
jgi:hypothetical protein